MTDKKILELKAKIDKAKTKNSESKGKLKQLMLSLKKEWKCPTVKEAKAKLELMKLDLKDLRKAKEKAVKELDQFDL